MNCSIKILFLSRNASDDNSAYTHRLKSLARGLTDRGFRCDFFYMSDFTDTSHTMLPLYRSRLRQLFNRYHIIHAGGTPAAFAANLCKPFQARVFYDMHGDRIAEIQTESRLGKEVGPLPVLKAFTQELGAMGFSNHFLAVSGPLKHMTMSRGIKEERISIIRNGVNLSVFNAGPDRFNRVRKITYAGQFQSYQAVNDLVAAARMWKGPSVVFTFIGFSQEETAAKTSIRKDLGNGVCLTDRMSQADLVKRLKESDILVIPRRSSRVTRIAFPTKFAEFIALGKPVLVSDVDETADFVTRYQCGMVYHQPSALGEVLMRMVKMSDMELQAMGRRGRRLAEKVFNWDSITLNYERLILQSCGHRFEN
ncbi:MAG TPA: glycosyltransferase [bacterium]|nr:glycosyltransferase [bacterium]